MPSFEEERVAYYIEYGEALAAWVHVENALSLVAKLFFDEGMPRNMIAIGLTGIQGFHSKLQFVDRCVTRGIAPRKDGPTLQEVWNELVVDLDSLSSKRNHLAHYLTMPFEKNKTEGRRIALCPWVIQKGTDKTQPPAGSYCVVDLIRTHREFSEMNVRLLNFCYQLVGSQERLERSVKPEDSLPTIQQIVDQIHEELGHRRVSAKEKKRDENARNAAASLAIHAALNATEGADTLKATGKIDNGQPDKASDS